MNKISNIIFDKSTLQALSFDEIKQLKNHVKIVVTSPLMREIQANLTNTGERNKVTQLSSKLNQSETIYQYAIESIIESELLGIPIPRDGKPLLFSNQIVLKNDRPVIKEPEPSMQINRWANDNYQLNDFNLAQNLKSYHQSIDLNKNKERWVKEINPPKFQSLQECRSWLENALDSLNQENLLLFLLDEIVKSEKKTLILQRWRAENFSRLRDFTWAGYWHICIFLFLCFGVSSDLIPSSKRAKSFLDIEYISYLPYSHGISSGDNLFQEFYAIFSRQDQVFISTNEIKDRLAELKVGKRKSFF